MGVKNELELTNTRERLRELEERYQARRGQAGDHSRAHELTLQSLMRVINQLKEEIARYEAHSPVRR